MRAAAVHFNAFYGFKYSSGFSRLEFDIGTLPCKGVNASVMLFGEFDIEDKLLYPEFVIVGSAACRRALATHSSVPLFYWSLLDVHIYDTFV